MTVLFGHPGGNPNSHHAALAHWEAGWLEAFCVPWMPTPRELEFLRSIPGLRAEADRLSRRSFLPLFSAPRIEGRLGEWSRMARRTICGRFADEGLSYEANDWLMRTMRRACARPAVTAVHAYEDCSLWIFEEARHRGKACIYDLPIGYYPAWEQKQAELVRDYSDWLPPGGLGASRHVRREQKIQEMELADLVLVPSTFVRRTVEQFVQKSVALCPYGVDSDFWYPGDGQKTDGTLRFIYAGQCSLRKGIPILLKAWEIAGLKDARLDLIGSWQFAENKLKCLPEGVTFVGPVSTLELRARYQGADVFVFPSFFEGFGLVILEAMACGLPVIVTDATVGPDVLVGSAGRIIPAGDIESLAESLRWFVDHRDQLPVMKIAARKSALVFGWEQYRRKVTAAASSFV
jgi:glycosyltransferase involved in cell wall biosynthesis